jgi:hypothetical protein
MKSLEKKRQEAIDRINAEYEIQIKINTAIGESIPYSVVDSRFVTIKPTSRAQLALVLNALEPENEFHFIDTKSIENLMHKYRIDLKNDHHERKVRISFVYMGIVIWITFDPSYIEGHISHDKRHPYDSEHHYFTGLTFQQIHKTWIPCIFFPATKEFVKWYGGDITLTDLAKIDAIISELKQYEQL